MREFAITRIRVAEVTLNSAQVVLALLDEAYEKKTWHGPNLKQSIKGVSAKQAAWRPGPGRHNIWEVTLHAAYWKYALLKREHQSLRKAAAKVLRSPRGAKLLRQLYGIAFHDVYHAGQIRLLRRLMER